MKKLFIFALCIMSLFAFTGCKPEDPEECPKCEECPKVEECPKCEECPKVNPEDLTPSPVVTGVVYHWVPGAIEANVTATADLKEASADSLQVLLAGKVLENYVDYELVDGTLTIFGATLNELGLELGSYDTTVVSEHGTAKFTIEVVANASLATSVEKKTIKGVDMTTVDSYIPTEVIAGAPEIMITEVGVDMYEYSYIEVFNNTNTPYNLKNHRIVFSNLTKQNLLADFGLFEEPLGMAAGAYIYQDYVIPALSTAVIWVVASYPWAQAAGTLLDGTDGRVMSEVEGADAYLFGTKAENLSVEKFRSIYGLDEDTLVFPVRPQPCLVNATSMGDELGFGAAPIKGESSRLSSFNSKIADRGIQIQKFELEKKITVEGVEGVAYYKYDAGVLNKEEDVYTDGAFDRSKIVVYGGRENVNAFYARIAYYDAADQLVGYASGANGIDAYSADKPAYLKMYQEAVVPLSTALIYGTYEDVEGVMTLANWGQFRSLEYTIPDAAAPTLMRYIPLAGTRATYETELAKETTGALKLLGLAPEVAEISADKDLVVPVSNAYPTDYLSKGYNTIGRGLNANFVVAK